MKTLLSFLVVFSIFSFSLSAQNITELCASQNTDGTVVDFLRFQDAIYATGFFQNICGQNVHHVAKWDGSDWQPLGPGLTDPGHSLREIDGQLFVARYEESIDSNWVQFWTGDEWAKFGPGVYLTTASGFSELPNIYDVIKYGGQIVACGEFDRARNEEVSGIMAWNGTAWEALGGGLSGHIPNTAPVMFPHRLFEFGGDLIVCGNFEKAGGVTVNGIARWDGTEWQAMGEGFDNTVYGLGEYNGELYAGGAFTKSGTEPFDRIAKWDGSGWVSPGFGFQPESGSDFIFVHTFAEIDDRLHIAGGLKKVVLDDGTEVPCGGIVAWDGTAVNTFNGGVAGNDIEAIVQKDLISVMVGGGVFGTGYLGEYHLGGTPTFEKTAQVLELSPNPVRGRLQFSGFAEMGAGELHIFSSFGHEVFHENGFRLENGLDVGRLLAGAYFVRFATGGEEFVGRFVRE